MKGSNHSYIGNLDKINDWNKTHLTGCIGEIIGFHRRLTDEENSNIHKYLMKVGFSFSLMIGSRQGDPI